MDSGDDRVVRAALGAGRVVDLKKAEVAVELNFRGKLVVRRHLKARFSSKMRGQGRFEMWKWH